MTYLHKNGVKHHTFMRSDKRLRKLVLTAAPAFLRKNWQGNYGYNRTHTHGSNSNELQKFSVELVPKDLKYGN